MGQSTSNSPFTVTKRIEQVIATRSSERKDNQVSENEVPNHRENIKFVDRIDESFRGTAMRFLNTKTKQEEELSSAQEQFFVECAMRFFNVDGSDRMVKHVFKKLLFPALRLIDLPPSTIVFKEGEDGTNAYLIEDGELEVSDANGVEYCLIGKGHVIGETSLMFDRERNATVTTLTKTRLRSFDRTSFGSVQMALSKNAKMNHYAQRFLELGPVVDLPWCFQERIANQLTTVSYNRGKRVCTEGFCSTNTIVIERGVIHVHVPESLLAMVEPHRTMLDMGRTTGAGWDINAVTSLPPELLHAMGISLPINNKDDAKDNEDPTSETSDDASVNSDNTQQTMSTNFTHNTTIKYGSNAMQSNAMQSPVVGKLHDALTSHLRRSSTSVSNIDKSNGQSLLRQSQRSPSLSNRSLALNGSQRGLADVIDRSTTTVTNDSLRKFQRSPSLSNGTLSLNDSQRGLLDIMDRSTTTVANGDFDGNHSVSGQQMNRRASSVTSISSKSPVILPKIGSESSSPTSLASSEKDVHRTRRSSVDTFSTNGSLLNSTSKQSVSMPATPNRSPSLTLRKSSLLSAAERKQLVLSALSMSGKSDLTNIDNKQSGSCKMIREDDDNSDDNSMDSKEEAGPLVPLRDISSHRLSQRSPTQMISNFSSTPGMANADSPGPSKSINNVSNVNTMMLLSPVIQTGTGLSSSEKNGVKRMSGTSRVPSSDSLSDNDYKPTRRLSSKTSLSARQGSSSSAFSLVSASQSDSGKYHTKSSSGAVRRDSKQLFLSLVEKFVPSEKETSQEEKDNGYVMTDISTHSESSQHHGTSNTNGVNLPVHLISSMISTNIIPAATDEQGLIGRNTSSFTTMTNSSISSSLDSSPRRDDNHYPNGSSSVGGGGGGPFKLQSKSPPLMSESERSPVANNRIAPLDTHTGSTSNMTRGSRAVQPLFEKQLFGGRPGGSIDLSSSQHGQRLSEKESDLIIALGPGCMIGKRCLDSLLHRPGAPEWKDEITHGTLNVGSVSSITAVVPSDSTDRVQVMCLSSYGYQKAIGNTMSNNGFERQIPLAEVAQNLKDDYTSSYVLQGAYRPSAGLTKFTMESFEDLQKIKLLADGIGEVMKARIQLSETQADDGDDHADRPTTPDQQSMKLIRRDSFGGDRNNISPSGTFSSEKKWERSLSFQLIASLGMGSSDAPIAAPISTSFAAQPSVSPIMFKAAATAVLVNDHNNNGDRDCVLKIFRKTKLIDSNKVAAALRESSILSSPEIQQCPFVVRLIGKFQTNDSMVLVMDHVARRDLKTLMTDIKSDHVPREKRIQSVYYYINQPPQLSLELVKYYTASVIAALAHLHIHRIIYRNLKPENIMIDKRGHVKLIDMSCAKILPFHDHHGVLHNRTYTICGLAEYMCPEMIQRTGHNSAADSWQVGILLYELLTGKSPFADAAIELRTNTSSGRKSVHRVSDGDAKILTSIAAVQYKGVQKMLPTDVCDSLNKVEGSLQLLLAFLHTVPSNRIPLILNPTSAICTSLFFKNFDWKALLAGSMYPPYVPPPVKAPVNTENITNRRLSFTSTQSAPTVPIKKETTIPIENKNFMEATSASLSAIATHSTAPAMSNNGTSTNNSKQKNSGLGKQTSGRARGGSKPIVDITTIDTTINDTNNDNDHQQVTDQSLFDGF